MSATRLSAHLSHADDSSTSQTPIVTTSFSLVTADGLFDGLLSGAFQGFNPPVTGGLTLAVGQSAYDTPGASTLALPLQHVIAGSPVVDPLLAIDLNFATPASGADNGSNTDIGIAATTLGFSALIEPLDAALQGTTLGGELAPLLSLAGGLLPGFGKNGGLPRGGHTNAKPVFGIAVGASSVTTTTIFGIPTVSSASGSLTIDKLNAGALIATANDVSTLFTDDNALNNDISSGNLLGALVDGAATLGAGLAVADDIGTLITDAAGSTSNPLQAIRNPQLSLNLTTQDSQSYTAFNLGLGTPTQESDTLTVNITADRYGAYALGQLLALYAPQLINEAGGTLTAEQTFAQLAQGVSALTSDIFSATGSATGVPSAHTPDIALQATLVTTEDQNTLLGSSSTTQTFSLNFESNAQGFYDLGSAAQAALTQVLVGLLETPSGQEALQIGGTILSQIDSSLGGGGIHAPPLHQHWATAVV